MLATINTALALIALGGGLLAARGYLPHVDFWTRSPGAYLARGLLLCALSAFPRLTVWDLVWHMPAMREIVAAIGASPINLGFNMLLLGLWHILHARWLIIPPPHRRRYNVLTAAFYPGCILPQIRARKTR